MLGCSSSGSRPAPSTGGGAVVVERVREEDRQRGEERAEAEQHRGRVRGDLPNPPARQEQDQARPQRQQEHPQQQRPLLRGPRRGRLVERRRGRRGVRGDDVEREVGAQERGLEDHRTRTTISPASAYTERRPESTQSGLPGDALRRARRRSRRARRAARGSAARDRAGPSQILAPRVRRHQYDEAAAWYLDGHLVVSEFCWPTNVVPCS